MPQGPDSYKTLLKHPTDAKNEPKWNGMIVYAFDPKTGKVYANAGADEQHDPASLNKLMILKLVLEAIDQQKISITQEMLVTADAARPKDAKINGVDKRVEGIEASRLTKGTKVEVKDLLNYMITASDNGAALLLGHLLEQVYHKRPGSNPSVGSAKSLEDLILTKAPKGMNVMPSDGLQKQGYYSVKINGEPLMALPERLPLPVVPVQVQMNEAAKKLGMNSTHYANPHGLPTIYDKLLQKNKVPKDFNEKDKDLNMSTARDTAILLADIMKKYPDAMDYLGKASVTYPPSKQDKIGYEEAHHFLLDKKSPQRVPSDYKVAAKTGYTDRAKHNIGGNITDADQHELIVVIMGSKTRKLAELKKMGLFSGEKGNEIKGNHVRDALVKYLSAAAFAEEHAQEKEQKKNLPKPTKDPLGFLNPEPLNLSWQPVPATPTPITFDGDYSAPARPVINPPAGRKGSGPTV